MEHHLKKISDYLVKVTEYNVENVTISDREEIINYFTGKVSHTNCINQEAKLALSLKPRTAPTSGFEDIQEEPSKKIKTDPLEIQILEQVFKFERVVMSKNRVIRNKDPNNHNTLSHLLKAFTSTQPAAKVEQTHDKKMRINSIIEKKKNPIIVVP